MFENYFIKKLKVNENKIKILRKYWLLDLPIYLLAFLVILLSFFLTYPLFKIGIAGILFWLILIIIGQFIAIRQFYIWQFNVFLVTNQRIIDFDQNGFFHKVVSEITFDKIQDISYNKKGILATIFNYGNVVIQTAGTNSNIELNQVYKPDQIQELLTNYQQRMLNNN